jgi:hypothetical protein
MPPRSPVDSLRNYLRHVQLPTAVWHSEVEREVPEGERTKRNFIQVSPNEYRNICKTREVDTSTLLLLMEKCRFYSLCYVSLLNNLPLGMSLAVPDEDFKFPSVDPATNERLVLPASNMGRYRNPPQPMRFPRLRNVNEYVLPSCFSLFIMFISNLVYIFG